MTPRDVIDLILNWATGSIMAESQLLMNKPRSPTLFISFSTEFVLDYPMQVISSSIVKWEGEEQPLA